MLRIHKRISVIHDNIKMNGRLVNHRRREIVRSRESRDPAYITLINTTERPVDVYWIDFEAQPILYNPSGSIEPGGKIVLNTFSTHPWMFCDARTGEPMHVNHNRVLWPPPWFANININRIRRATFQIHLPLRSLKVMAQSVVCGTLQTDENIKNLELPLSLCRDLKIEYMKRMKLKMKKLG